MANLSSSPVLEENVDNTANCSQKQNEEPEWVLARQGINLLINNNQAEAEALFLKYPDSLVMFAGYTFTVFMDALMSFEDDKLSKAILRLKEVEKRCSIQAGWIKSLSQKVFGTPSTDTQSLAEQLETQIILADSQVCIAILTFLQQDLSGYFKGGWVLRKAWKVYQRTYKEILTLYKGRVGELQLPDPILSPLSPPSPCTRHSSDSEDEETSPWDVPEQPVNGCSGLRKRKRDIDENKRPLTSAELEACLNDSEESDFELSSDDGKDRSFNPDREESSSESEENVEYSSLDDISRNVKTPEVPTTTEAENIEEKWTDIEEDPTEFPFAGAKEIRVSDELTDPTR